MFIGEAPGRQESIIGRPFIGRSGQLLRRNIKRIGLLESDVYITSPVKYLPDRGTPTATDIEHGMTHLRKQIKVISPKIIVLLGSVAIQGVLKIKPQVLKHHGEVVEKEGINYFLTIHPAAAIRFQKNLAVFESDFNVLKKLVM